ncbi:hypothetical protein HJG60_012289 [Phyllostomus discolor]|uniref:Uncharacterized protein n=1 Tax=Phyllostomus discolor TaxID=89673 RepID=A0A833ZG97_9CHIR|nr:hypothetical protein HJG60_012289 [Phyllostomus discolor]
MWGMQPPLCTPAQSARGWRLLVGVTHGRARRVHGPTGPTLWSLGSSAGAGGPRADREPRPACPKSHRAYCSVEACLSAGGATEGDFRVAAGARSDPNVVWSVLLARGAKSARPRMTPFHRGESRAGLLLNAPPLRRRPPHLRSPAQRRARLTPPCILPPRPASESLTRRTSEMKSCPAQLPKVIFPP